jgi:U3 small nucleolar RNA-associated protein 10
LVSDSLKPKPGISQVLLGIGSDDGGEPQKVAVDLLRDLAYLFKHSSLKVKMAKTFASEDEEAIRQLRTIFSQILEQVLTIGDSVQSMKLVSQANGDVLAALFGTLTLVDFLDTIEVLLERPNDELRRKVLRLLEGRLRQNPERDSASQIRVLDFLPTLVDIIRSSTDILLKHAAVACIDRIAEKYGKKDPSRVVGAAQVVASEACIGQTDDRIRIMGVLCLASMAETLGQVMIPALPEALSRSLALLELSLEEGKENSRLHDAVFSLFSALFVHIPYMISGPHLDKILILSCKSANAEDCEDESRQEALKMMARKVDMAATLGAVDRNWQYAVQAGPVAAKETLEVVSLAVEKHPKSATGKNIGVLSSILFKAFDLRREQLALGEKATFDATDVDEIEDALNDVTIKMIYKLNDTTFRPIFAKMLDWATSGLPKKDSQGSWARLTTFYKFLQVFFGTLQVCYHFSAKVSSPLTKIVYRHWLCQLYHRKRGFRPRQGQSNRQEHQVSMVSHNAFAPQCL